MVDGCQNNNCQKKGLPLSQIDTVHRNTSGSYKKLSACSNKRKYVSKVQQKTENRFIAENSVISTITYLFTVATTHLFIGKPSPKIHTYKLTDATPDAQLLASLVSRANNGVPIHHVLPAMVTSTDDTTVFVFRGASTKLEGWYLTESKLQGNKQSLFSNDEGGTDQKKGLRVRLTFTLNAIGMMAATYISVTGITEKELPKSKCPSGIYIMKIPGLCPGGGSDPRLNAPGFVVFLRAEKSGVSGKTAEGKKFERYREHVLLPFLSTCRENFYGWHRSSPVPDTLTAVCWCDGANVQLKAITNEQQQIRDKINKIITCKHSASRTSVEQACDCCPVFRSLKAISKSITKENAPHIGLKRVVSTEFKKLDSEGVLNLNVKKRSAMVDFLACYPDIIMKSASHKAVSSGFADNGMIDEQTSSYPDMNAIMRTCKSKAFTKKYEQIIGDNFTELYEEQSKHGILSDSFLEKFDFLVDKKYDGSIVSRTSECEAWQRAKCLSADYQRNLRLLKVQLFADDSTQRGIEAQTQTDDIHAMNISCTNNILKVVDLRVMPHPRPQCPDLSLLPLLVFAECSKPMLRGFIHVRMFDSVKSCIEAGFKWPKNKGKLQDAINGEYNLIKLAHSVACKNIILPINSIVVSDITEEGVATAADLSSEEPTMNEVSARR